MPVRANMLTLRQAGLTLVELLVAMVLMLLVAIATVAMYNVSSSSYRTVDANQELQDSARFAMEIIGRAFGGLPGSHGATHHRKSVCRPSIRADDSRSLACRRPQWADPEWWQFADILHFRRGQQQRRAGGPIFWCQLAGSGQPIGGQGFRRQAGSRWVDDRLLRSRSAVSGR